MRLTSVFVPTLLATSLSSTIAAPVQNERRGNDTPFCYGGPGPDYMPTGSARSWVVGIPHHTLGNSNDEVGGGLLDNLRGQCGVISVWKAGTSSGSLAASFVTTIFCSPNDVHNAIWLANGVHLDATCTYAGAPGPGGLAGAVAGINGFLTGVFQVLGFL